MKDKGGRPGLYLTRAQLDEAFERTHSVAAAAKYLGISYNTLKDKAKHFLAEDGKTPMFEYYKNQAQKGVIKNARVLWGDRTVKTQDILDGNVPLSMFTYRQLKHRLIGDGYLKPVCCKCGHCSVRKDGLRPVLLQFKDKDRKNIKLDNLEIVCYNCFFLEHGKIVINEEYIPGFSTIVIEDDEEQPIGTNSNEYNIFKNFNL